MSKSVLLIVSGSVAAYKALDLVRVLKEKGASVTCVLTEGGSKFITPLSLSALSGNPVYTDLFSLQDEAEMGHIRLSREHDVIAVAPASADMIARMAAGRADDLAASVVLASNKPVLVAPAMNTYMWNHPATQRNIAQICADGVVLVEPSCGLLACGETGAGRLAEVEAIAEAIWDVVGEKPLAGLTALVTSGPTFEPMDPVRFIGNRSSGKQGHAIARALTNAGAQVTLVSGPVAERHPPCTRVINVESAVEMLEACQSVLPVDIAVCVAAVGDWRVSNPSPHKLKKRDNASPPEITLTPNPDILHTLSQSGGQRPRLVVGFAAETENLQHNASQKRNSKGCDWIVANDVSEGKVFAQEGTSACLITQASYESWQDISKSQLAVLLTQRIIQHFRNED